MITIPPTLRTQFEARLRTRQAPGNVRAAYTKWLRYYLDFCHKYHFSPEKRESLGPFLRKLEEKRQTKTQREQASDAITLYYEIVHSGRSQSDGSSSPTSMPWEKIFERSSHPPVLSVQEI